MEGKFFLQSQKRVKQEREGTADRWTDEMVEVFEKSMRVVVVSPRMRISRIRDKEF